MFNLQKVTTNSVVYLGKEMILTQTYMEYGYHIMEENKFISIEIDEAIYCFNINDWSIDGVYYSTTSEFINVLYA